MTSVIAHEINNPLESITNLLYLVRQELPASSNGLQYVTQAESELERISGIRAPALRIPYAVAYAAGVASTAWSYVTGAQPRAPLDGVRMARKKMWVSHAKASRELGFAPAPAETGLAKAVEWFRTNGYVQ